MWAGRRSAGALWRLTRGISSYGASRYAAVRNAAAVEETPAVSDSDRRKMKDVIKAAVDANNQGLDMKEALEGFRMKLYPGALETAIGKSEATLARAIFEWGKSMEGFEYNRKLVANFMYALRKCNRPDLAREFVNEVAEKAGDSELERIARSMLYSYYVYAKDDENAEKVKAELQERGLVLDSLILSQQLISAFETGGSEAMFALSKEHINKGLLPESHTLGNLIIMLIKKNHLDDAVQIYKQYDKEGVEFRENTHMMLVGALIKKERFKEAQEIAKGLLKLEVVRGDASALKTILIRLAGEECFEEAMKMLKLLVGQKHASEASTALVKSLIKAKEWDKAVEVLELMQEHSVGERGCFKSVITELCKDKQLALARRAFDAMVGTGLTPDAEVCAALAMCAATSN